MTVVVVPLVTRGHRNFAPEGGMAQAQKARKQAQDTYAQRGKALASSVQLLSGWVGTDPSRAPELADALIELTEHRLLGHGYAAAAGNAQDAVRRSAHLLTANGPIGPYTTAVDAARYVTAVVQLATIQVGVGLPAAAGQLIDSLHDLQHQLQELRLEEHLQPQTVIWALSCAAQAALVSGDVAPANAYADAALARLAESGLRGDPDAAYLAIDIDRLASDCRWAARHAGEALAYLHAARVRYEEVVGGRLFEPAGLSPALTERLAEPLFGLYRDLADRLAASGETDVGLVTRRALVELLRGLARRLGDPAHVQLASALADLAEDLLRSDRVTEADAMAAEAAAAVPHWSGAEPTRLLVAATRARTLTRTEHSGEAVTVLREVLPAEPGESPVAAHAVGLHALAEALRADGDLDAARSTEEAFHDLARDLLGPAVEGIEAGTALRNLARGVVAQALSPITWPPLPPTASYAATTASAAAVRVPDEEARMTEWRRQRVAWLESERAEAHRAEQDQLEQARIAADRRETERADAERAAADKEAAERTRAEAAKRLEAEHRAAAEEADRLERKRRRAERLEAHRLEVERRAAEREAADPVEADRQELERAEERARVERVEVERVEAERVEAERAEAARLAQEQAEAERAQAALVETQRLDAERRAKVEPDELALAQQAWQDAKARGDRRGARGANERVVELLRSRVEVNLKEYGPELRNALEELSSARLRSGDVWGSRAPAKEAKTLAKALGR